MILSLLLVASLFSPSAIPTTASANSSVLELGLQFRSDISGTITAIRFYKSTDPNSHPVSLWSPTGSLLATGAGAETSSGWQEISIPPVSITAGAVYTASYQTSSPFLYTSGFFVSQLDNAPLHGILGVYQYGGGFPANSYNASNYGVDIVFSPSYAAPPPPCVVLAPGVWRIMPLGDSITVAGNGYREALWALLSGRNVDFVGSQQGPGGPDADHEGHDGYRTDQIEVYAATWMALSRPDIVLLHVGTNDIRQFQSTTNAAASIGRIIDALRSVNPGVRILLAQIIPMATFTNEVQDLNAQIATVASQKHVLLVDQWTGFSVSTDTWDGIHENATGGAKMAAKFYASLNPVITP